MIYISDMENMLGTGTSVSESNTSYVGTLGALRIIEESHVNDHAIFEAMYASDCVELAYRRILEADGVDEEKKEEAAEKVEENKEKTKKSLIETIKNLIETVKQKILEWLDNTLNKINKFRHDKMIKFVNANKDEFMKKDITGFEKELYVISDDLAKSLAEMDDMENVFTKEFIVKTVETVKAANDGKADSESLEAEIGKIDKKKDLEFKQADGNTMSNDAKKIPINKTDIVKALEDETVNRSMLQTKSKFKAVMDKLKKQFDSEDKDSADLSMYITCINALQRNRIKKLNYLLKVYSHDLSAYYSFFKAVVAYKGKGKEEKVDTTEEKVEESAFDMDFEDFLDESLFLL